MASSKLNLQVDKFTKKIGKLLKSAVSKKETKALAEEAIRLIVKRTRLGYGTKQNYGQRYKLPPLSTPYILRRRQFKALHGSTTPRKSNLTFTGQMLESMDIIRADGGMIELGPTGRRREGRTNQEIAKFNAENGRVFNRLSQNEFNQLVRFYRKNFGDLLHKLQLIR